MALTKKGEFWYGTTSGDTQAELCSYSVANGHEAVRFAASKCDCGCRSFALQTDEVKGCRTPSRAGAPATHAGHEGWASYKPLGRKPRGAPVWAYQLAALWGFDSAQRCWRWQLRHLISARWRHHGVLCGFRRTVAAHLAAIAPWISEADAGVCSEPC